MCLKKEESSTRSILRESIMCKYELYDGMILTINDIQNIALYEEISMKEIIYLLGVYRGIMYNENAKYSRININKHSSIKDCVKMIVLDLKYLKEYSSRSYSHLEIKIYVKDIM